MKRVRDGLTWDMNESTFATQWVKVGGTFVNPEGDVPLYREESADRVLDERAAAAARKLGDGLRAIADMLDERERLYGPAVSSWERIARLAGVTPEQALEVMIVMKRERALFSPENPDHVRDQIGYLAILTEVRRGR